MTVASHADWFSSALHRLDLRFTACTQGVLVSHLREAGVLVQSQVTQLEIIEKKVEVDQDGSRSLPALRRYGMEDSSRQPSGAQKPRH
jgi:hypothetical protein